MSLNVWIGLLIVLVPALVVVSIAGALRICLLVVGDEQPEHTSRGGQRKPTWN